MAKYSFPAIFTPEESGKFSINFPDVNCYTQGEDVEDGIEMAQDALCLMLYDMEQRGEEIPKASDIEKLTKSGSQLIFMISCDTQEYVDFFSEKGE